MDLRLLVFVFFVCVVHGFTIPYEGLYKLDIVHYNDFHARFEETSVETPSCRFNNNSCLGGFPRLYHEIQVLLHEKPDAVLLNAGDSFQGTYWYTLLKWNITQQFMNLLKHDAHTPNCRFNNNSCLGDFPRLYQEIQVLLQEKPDAVLLNAGDSFQGTYWYTLLKWNITQQFMNLLKHDGHALGNHEFDDGPGGLAPYLSALKAPVLAANMDASKEPSLQGLFKPSIVIKRKGRKIGIIGLITPDTKTLSSPGNVEFTDPGEATRREAEALTNEGVDIIILLSHCGLEVDKQLARDYGQYIDIIIGGHSHSLLWNGPSPSGEGVAGPYPVFVENVANKHQVLIVQASAFTKYMGNMSVYFNFRGQYVKHDGGPIYLDRTIAEDEAIKAKLAPYAKLVHEAESVPIGETKTTLNYEDCVFGECTLGDVLVEAFNDHAKSVVKTDKDYLAFIQRGNIKTSILKGAISQGSIFELLPYNDRIETFELQGKYVLEALQRSVVSAWAYTPFKGPWVLQVSGVRVVYNVTLPEGSRLTSATTKKGVELMPDQMYQVTAPIYLADGGDGYTMFKDNRVNRHVIGRDQRLLEAYIKKHSPLNVATDGRIEINY